MRSVNLPDGRALPVLGLGTWRMGESASHKAAEVRVVQKALDLGISLIDTAEIYANGGSERVVGEAIRGRRDQAFVVSKAAPSNASRRGAISACEASLGRLGIETLDLYLLHWRGRFPVHETVEAFERLLRDGKIRAWGMSNFDSDDLKDIPNLAECAANQVLYNPQSRGIEHSLLPFCNSHHISIMAYTPFGQNGAVLNNPAIAAIARRHKATPAQVILAWGIRHPGVVTIPKTATLARVEENLGAVALNLTAEDLGEIDRAFPPPRQREPLEML
ncbi:MAG TPA: aldo/keto reductase [Acidisoma sp.]|jgi:diketogulonate reductase-like aldo/keto reductase|nr:aldo/keto reductase [Acidisoma sp.]